MDSLSKAKALLLATFGLMVVALVLYVVAISMPDWLVMSCSGSRDVKMGLWQMCVEPYSDCVSFVDHWNDMPTWVRASVGLHLTGLSALVLTTLLMLCYLMLSEEAVLESISGLGFAALGTASFIVVGQMVMLGETSRVYALFAYFDDFSDVDCVGEDDDVPKAKSSWCLIAAWIVFTTMLCAALPLVVVGALSPAPTYKTTTSRKLQGGGGPHDNNDFVTDDENHNERRRTATKLIHVYSSHGQPIPTTSDRTEQKDRE